MNNVMKNDHQKRMGSSSGQYQNDERQIPKEKQNLQAISQNGVIKVKAHFQSMSMVNPANIGANQLVNINKNDFNSTNVVNLHQAKPNSISDNINLQQNSQQNMTLSTGLRSRSVHQKQQDIIQTSMNNYEQKEGSLQKHFQVGNNIFYEQNNQYHHTQNGPHHSHSNALINTQPIITTAPGGDQIPVQTKSIQQTGQTNYPFSPSNIQNQKNIKQSVPILKQAKNVKQQRNLSEQINGGVRNQSQNLQLGQESQMQIEMNKTSKSNLQNSQTFYNKNQQNYQVSQPHQQINTVNQKQLNQGYNTQQALNSSKLQKGLQNQNYGMNSKNIIIKQQQYNNIYGQSGHQKSNTINFGKQNAFQQQNSQKSVNGSHNQFIYSTSDGIQLIKAQLSQQQSNNYQNIGVKSEVNQVRIQSGSSTFSKSQSKQLDQEQKQQIINQQKLNQQRSQSFTQMKGQGNIIDVNTNDPYINRNISHGIIPDESILKKQNNNVLIKTQNNTQIINRVPSSKNRENHSLGEVPSQLNQQMNQNKTQTLKIGTPNKIHRRMSPNRQLINNGPPLSDNINHQKNQSVNSNNLKQSTNQIQAKQNQTENYIQKNELLRQSQDATVSTYNTGSSGDFQHKIVGGQNGSHKKQWSAITILPTQFQQSNGVNNENSYQNNRSGSHNQANQQNGQFDMKQAAAPASGVISQVNQYQIQTSIIPKNQQNQFLHTTQHNPTLSQNSLIMTAQSQDLSGTLSNKNNNKQIPLRQPKVRNQNPIINNNDVHKILLNKNENIIQVNHQKQNSGLLIQKSQNADQKMGIKMNDKGNRQSFQIEENINIERIEKEKNGQDDNISIEKLNLHQRKDARIPSANKQQQRVNSGKRVPSAKRIKNQIQEQQNLLITQIKSDKESDSQAFKKDSKTKYTPKNDNVQKEVAIKELVNPNIKSGNQILEKTRSSITNIKRSRNEGKNGLPLSAIPSDHFDPTENPTSAGQSTSSLYKQEQIRQKFKVNIQPQPSDHNKDSQQISFVQQDFSKDLTSKNQKLFSPKVQHNESKSNIDKPIDSKKDKHEGVFSPVNKPIKEGNKNIVQQNNYIDQKTETEDQNQDKNIQQKGEIKNAFNQQTTGLSGRNLYFNQIRNEISLSETNKIKGLPDYQNAKFSNKRNGLVAGYGANTNQGIVRNYNEDRVAIILNIMKPKSKNYENQQWPKCSFFGIYDGHGGAVCADFLRDYLHQFIIKDENFPQNPIQALRNGFREAERLFIEFAESQEKEAGEIDRSGSCAVVILIIDDMCYCANTGDSRSIMSADGGEKLFLLSTDHKPTDEIEIKRIIEGGGRIYQNSQIIQTNPSLGEQGKQVVYGPHRVFPGRLSVSRTIGDIEAKIEKYEGNPNVVVADPDVTAFEIKDNHDFIVIGCDGVFDKLSSKDAIHIAWQKVLMECTKNNVSKVDLDQTHKNCGHCVDGILRISALRRTVDNVTCVVVAFDGFQKQLQKFINNNQDGTTVDVIEEIQLEPIPEYLSNTKVKKNDNSMLLLDENQLSDNDNPLFPQKKGNTGVNPNILKTETKINHLSEIAEEDDISGVSDSLNNPGKEGGKKRDKSKLENPFMDDCTLGEIGKVSIHSDTLKNVDKISIHEQDISLSKQVDYKRRSQILPYKSVSDQVSQSISDFSDKNNKQVNSENITKII